MSAAAPFPPDRADPADPALAGIVQRIDAVVVGASAGGVEALNVLLPRLPGALRVPVLVVLHLPRERPSLLVEIFAPRCALPVREAQDKEPVEAGVDLVTGYAR